MQPTNEPNDQQTQPELQNQTTGTPPENQFNSPTQPPVISNDPASASKSKMLPIIIGACIVLVLAGAAFVLLNNSSNKDEGANGANIAADESDEDNSSATKSLDGVQDVSFVTPDDMSTYQPVDTTDSFSRYITVSGQDSADNCRLNFGVVSEEELPGSDNEAILRPQMESLSKTGASISGPKKEKALVLQSADGKQSYSMSTFEVTANKDAAHGIEIYSVAILGNGKRAVVTRGCTSTSGPIDPASMQKLQATAEKLKVSIK